MLNRMICGIGLTFVLIGTLTLAFETLQTKPAMGNTWHVPGNFDTIQEAVYSETVVDGDIIEVHPKEPPYYETVVVNKMLTIRCYSEAPSGVYPIIEAPMHGHGAVFNVASPNVNISGFIIQHGEYGIYLSNQSATILNNTITSNHYGIYLFQSYNNTLRENRMTENRWNFGVDGKEINDFIQDIDVSNTVDGKPIYYWGNRHDETIPSEAEAGYVGIVNCVNITVEGLDVTHNREGVLIVNSTGAAIKDINITSNERGIWALMMDDSNITNVEVSDTDWGISLSNSSHNIISSNLMLDNGQYAWPTAVIELRFSSYNTIVDNKLSSQLNYPNLGVVLLGSSNNTIVANTVEVHDYGICLESSNKNVFYHNNIIDSRSEQVLLRTSPDNNRDNGHEGNYWSDYHGGDADGDGIGDTLYHVSYSYKDDYCPLMVPWSAWKEFEPPMEFYVETLDQQQLSTFSNSTLASLRLSRSLQQISLNATSGYSGFLNITIPRRWLDGPFEIEVDEDKVGYFCAPANANYWSLYITFDKGRHTITINGIQLGNVFGDLDGDGDVDLHDAVALLKYYGRKVPEPYYLEEVTS